MANIYDMADTWNDAGTAFTAIKMDVTDTASDAASLLLDLQVGGISMMKLSKAGALDLQSSDATAFTAGLRFGEVSFAGFNNAGVFFRKNDVEYVFIRPEGVAFTWTNGVFWNSSGNPGGTPDVGIARTGPNQLKVCTAFDRSGLGELIFLVPTTDPGITGALWNNSGTLAISA